MSDSTAIRPQWWGSCEVPHGATWRWHIGPMTLWIQRLDSEWRVATTVDDTDVDSGRDPAADVDDIDLMALDTVNRFAVPDASETVCLVPMLADRPVVTCPAKPVYIPASQQVTVFVGTPLWLCIEAGTPPTRLIEFPILRPSDTWFGPSPADGELCYASRTACRLRLDQVPLRPHRAMTAVRVHNRSSAPMRLERMNVPVAYLPLFCSADGVLWTRDVRFDYVDGEAHAALQYDGETPAHATDPEQVSPARQVASEDLATRVFSLLFR